MIKCNDVKVCAVISRAASEKTGKDGSKFLSFSVKPTITSYNGESKELDINVTFNGDRGRMAELTVGKRVQVAGTLSVNKRNGEVKFYLRAESVEVVSAEDADSIEGEMTFTGKIGKKGIEEKTDKNGNIYKTFSGFSSDKSGDQMEFIWVRFLYFRPKEGEDFLQASATIEVTGDLKLSVYNGAVTFECMVTETKPWSSKK